MEKSVIIFLSYNDKEVVTTYVEAFNIDTRQIFIGDNQLNALFDLSEDPTVYLNKNESIIKIPKEKLLINLKTGN